MVEPKIWRRRRLSLRVEGGARRGVEEEPVKPKTWKRRLGRRWEEEPG
jgi:hypothetical protein